MCDVMIVSHYNSEYGNEEVGVLYDGCRRYFDDVNLVKYPGF